MWDNCGMARDRKGLEQALGKIPALREEFWKNVIVPGSGEELNQSLERAGRVADFLELGELMCLDALERDESCGGHFRVEHQTPDGEATAERRGLRHVAAWEYTGDGKKPAAPQGAAHVRERAARRSELQMKLTLKVWRQKDANEREASSRTRPPRSTEDMSFLEMLDVGQRRADRRRARTRSPSTTTAARASAARAALVINGEPHGPRRTTACQLYMRSFRTATTLTIEPWRARAFPVIKDLVVDRSAFDRIMQAGGFISVATGSAPDANAIPVRKENADLAMDAAACIGCGACVAACKNATAMLFVAAKVSQLGLLPQGQPERDRARSMVAQMDAEGFGNCTNQGECEAVCPKAIRTISSRG